MWSRKILNSPSLLDAQYLQLIWNNFLWKNTKTSWATPTHWTKKKKNHWSGWDGLIHNPALNPTSSMATSNQEVIKNPEFHPDEWRNPTSDTTNFKTCTWKASPQHLTFNASIAFVHKPHKDKPNQETVLKGFMQGLIHSVVKDGKVELAVRISFYHLKSF